MITYDYESEDLDNAILEDVLYELEGSYEVYGLGRCRFVFIHCRMAMLIGISLLARKKGLSLSEGGIYLLGRMLGMPDRLLDSCLEIDRAGRYGSILEKRPDEQERAAIILCKTLETFEWMRREISAN